MPIQNVSITGTEMVSIPPKIELLKEFLLCLVITGVNLLMLHLVTLLSRSVKCIYASFAVFFQKYMNYFLLSPVMKKHNYCKTTKFEVCLCFGNSVFICMTENTSSVAEWRSSLIPIFDHKQRKLELLHMDQSCDIVSEGITRTGSVL